MMWSMLYWVLLVLAVLVLLRGLLWDRAGFRGRAKLRCRRCWYDLTGAVGDLREGPIVCPECGKKHASRRAMRRTHRHKRLVVVAMVLLLGAYAAHVWPRVSAYNYANGWLGAVPTPVLIATIPLMPEEPGSLPDRHSGNNSMPFKQRPWSERVANQINGRMYKHEETSILDRWLFAWLAHRESWRVLTDESSVRGQVFTYVYRALARQHRLGGGEERWARSVYWMDVESPEALPQMSPVYVRVNEFRRLFDEGHWRVQIGKTLFEPIRRSPDFIHKPRYVRGENGYHEGYVRIADYVRWPNMTSSLSYEDLPIRGRIYDGEPDVDIWWPVGVIDESARVEIAQFGQAQRANPMGSVEGVGIVEDEETIAWIERAVDIKFVWERRFPKEGDVPIGVCVSINRDRLDTNIPGFTFGGTIYLHCKIAGPQALLSGSFGNEMVMSEPSWWALRDDRDRDGRRIVEGSGRTIAFKNDRSELMRGAWGYSNADGISEAWFEIQPYGNTVGDGNYAPLWDLDAQRIFSKPIKVPLSEHEIRMLEGACRTMLERQGIEP